MYLVLLLLFAVAASWGSVPPGTSIDNQASASYTSSSGASTVAGSNVVHVITQAGVASVSITKSASQSSAKPGDHPAFTLTIINNGLGDALGVAVTIDGTPATKVIASDAIPNNTRFSSIVNAGGATPLYHIAGSPAQTYVSAAPSDLSTVDAVAFALNILTAGSSATFSFSVAVDANASGTIHNVAQIFFNNGSDTVAVSNAVDIPVTGPPPAIAYYFDSTFARVIHATALGSPLFVQVDAAACNLDPAVAETKAVTLTSTLTGDIETFTATETGPNTGVFRISPSVPTRDGSTNPVVPGNKIMEVLRNDQIVASMTGCGAASVTATVLIDPLGVVFDSRSNVTIAGASVTLIDVSGNGNGGHPNSPATVFQFDGVTPAPSTVTTSANGQFQFPQVLPSTYQVSVKPPTTYTFPSTVAPAQLPPGRHIDPSASYNGTFTVAANSGIVLFDVPVDAAPSTQLFVQKTAARTEVEIGDFIDYTVEIKNLLATPLPNVSVTDNLPPGFIYQARSARLNGVPINDPPGKGPVLTFSIGTLAANADVKLTYRVLVGPGSSIGDNINRASASAGGSQSNTSSAHVNVQGGAFSDKGFIVGKVFQDCNGNHMQDPGEMGVPGVRIYMEDGTFAITDGEGKYSIYGVSSRLHILKVDSYSLPKGSHLLALANRNGGDGGSRFIDMRFGELQKADFAISNCTAAMVEEIESRKKQVGGEQEVARAVKAQFNAQEIQKDSTQLKAMAASGYVDVRPTPQAGAGGPNADLASEKGSSGPAAAATGFMPGSTMIAATASNPPARVAAATPSPSVDLAKLTNELGFVDLHNNDVLPFAQTNIRIKGLMGNRFKLLVNGKEASAKEIGTKSVIADHNVEVWEFIGVNLQPGRNALEVTQFDPYGNARGTEKIELIAPSKLGKLKIAPEGRKLFPADGKTPVKFLIRLTDAADIPVTVRTPLTLEATSGAWLVKDLNPKEPGTQVFIEGGQAEFMLMPPNQAGSSTVRVTSGGVSAETKVEFVPELRPMMAAGVVEYQVNFGGLAHNSTQPSLNDGFEQQLNLFAMQTSDDSLRSAGHAALLLKGEIKGENLLTLAYDSDKTTRNQLFRDIQPDQYYPVYGDASVRGYDAQSTSKAYLRIDHGQSYIVYGDFLTTDPGTGNSLSNYSRSMTGVKTHFANDKFNLTGFASYDSLTQVVDELQANGTSGPFILSNPNGVENSEKVEILTRDRNQPSVIIDIRQLTRFADYEFEPFTGELLLKAPIMSLDSNLNPQSIRVTYEVNSGGPRFWTGGGMVQMKLNKFMQIGGTMVDDTNPQDPNKLFAFTTNIKLQTKTNMSAEFAGTEHELQGIGLGYRFVVEHDGEKLKGKAYFSRTDQDFNNPTSILNQGRGESGVKGSYVLGKGMRILAEFIRTEDVTSGGTQDGGEVALEKSLPGNILTRFGFRHSDETLNPANTADTGITPNTVNALETKLSMPIPHFNKLTATAEYEQDVSDADKRVVALGGSYQFWDRGRIYFRHELISSLGNVYSLNTLQGRSTTQFGVDTTYFKDAHVFSEYRIRDDLNGRDAEAAIGLRNNWHLAKGLTANTGIEDVKTLNGVKVDSLALTGAVEYTAQQNWKASARMEWRGSTSSDTILSTVGFAARLSDSWTFLSRNIISDTTNKGSAASQQIQDRMQLGFALRDAQQNRWNALTMVEFKNQNDNTNPLTPVKEKIGIFSATANYQVSAPFTVTGRYAAKWNLDTETGLSSSAVTQMFAGRAMWDLTRRWDIGFAASTLYSIGMNSRQYGFGPEIGYQIMPNVWVSTGYNFIGFKDADLSGEDVTRRGAFIRLRFKFDESLFLRKEQPKQ